MSNQQGDYEGLRDYINLRAIQEKLAKEDVSFLLTLLDPRKSREENRRRIDDEMEVIVSQRLRASLKPPPSRRASRGRWPLGREVALIIACGVLVAFVGGLALGSALSSNGPQVVPLTSNEVLVVMPPGSGENVSLPKSAATLLGWGYQPDIVRVVIGVNNTVVWVNEDRGAVLGIGVSVPHTVTNPQLLFHSGVMNSGDRFTHTFTSPGTYYYHCVYHPWMKGEVIVTQSHNA